MRVDFGTLHDVIGRPASHSGVTFVPALVELDGTMFSTEFYLRDFAGPQPPVVLAGPMQQQFDAAWVRARLPVVFGFVPEVAEVEKALLDVGFVAVPERSSVGIPFVCTDYYGRTGLTFSPEGPDRAIQALIARAFWPLLLQEPDELADFSARVYHPGTGNWMHFGCEHGEPYCEESTSSEDEAGDDDE